MACALPAVSVRPDNVAQVVIKHWHYDRVGGLPWFSAAEVIMTRTEYDFWTGAMASRALFAQSAEPAEIGHLRTLRHTGRLTLAGKSHQVAPGIELVEVGGHTPGQAIVFANTGPARVILASDAVHYYEELERDRPFSTVANLAEMYAAFDKIREMAQDASTTVIVGHDPAVAERFPTLHGQDGVVLLSQPTHFTKRRADDQPV